jgi:HAD superfamily hydrolase (TIGR01549 family)
MSASEGAEARKPAVILDIDGTLVDTNYHHAIAWHRAFRVNGLNVPAWQAHRHIGMGGDRLVEEIAGPDFEEEKGDAVREEEGEQYERLIDDVTPFDGAYDFLRALREEGHRVVLASSAKSEEVDHYLDLLEARDLVDGWTTSADVDTTKPAPDLVEVALKKAGGSPAVMVGDTVWDVISARRAGVACICVLTGGFSEAELLDAGAAKVVESVSDLVEVGVGVQGT